MTSHYEMERHKWNMTSCYEMRRQVLNAGSLSEFRRQVLNAVPFYGISCCNCDAESTRLMALLYLRNSNVISITTAAFLDVDGRVDLMSVEKSPGCRWRG